jgi:hypothetical protein
LSWLPEDGFYDMVGAKWIAVSHGDAPIEHWKIKYDKIVVSLGGWTKKSKW